MKAPLPNNEVTRLEALRRYKILDTAPEKTFDDLTILASYVTNCPIALVSLVDEDRQWFKSKVGISVSETSRDVAFCSWAILKSHIFAVHDATTDDRFRDNPLVTSEPRIRFYAGVPLINPEGAALGTLCVIDRQPRDLTPEQKAALDALGRQAINLLELRRVSADLAQALSNIKTLHGLLPICSHCKRIREDEGSWTRLEKYISSHSEAEFSHGICPSCVQEHYSEWVGKKPVKP